MGHFLLLKPLLLSLLSFPFSVPPSLPALLAPSPLPPSFPLSLEIEESVVRDRGASSLARTLTQTFASCLMLGTLMNLPLVELLFSGPNDRKCAKGLNHTWHIVHDA